MPEESSSAQVDVVQQYSCRCHNITINAYKSNSAPPAIASPEPGYQRVFVGEHGINIAHHCLTLRARDAPQESNNTPNKVVQHLALSCLACKTLAYRVGQEISPGSEAREGPVIPTEDWVEQETLLSKSGWIEVFVGSNGCLVGKDVVEAHLRSLQLSPTFFIGVLSQPPTPVPSSPKSSSWKGSEPDNSVASTIPAQILPSLPSLFPPPPFSPSHPVFLSLSARAVAKSTQLREKAEEEAKQFVKSKLETLHQEEAILRAEVEGIWRGYREGWKEVLGRVNEERQRAQTPKSEASAASVRSGIPMSIRDFSPIVRSHPPPSNSSRSWTQSGPSSSLLSASLAVSGRQLLARSPGPSNTLSGVATSASAHESNDLSSNGSHSPGSPSSLASSDMLTGAFKRNMDTSVDIASSVKWAQGEEEMRRRFGEDENGEPRERARKRTSKNLDIGAVETKIAPSQEESNHVTQSSSTSHSKSKAQTETGLLQDKEGQVAQAEPSKANGTSKKNTRKVTFDVQPAVAVSHEATKNKQLQRHAAEVELFDLDDVTSTGPLVESELLQRSDSRPQSINRTPPYKLIRNDGTSSSRPSQAASLPVHRAIPPGSPMNGNLKWMGSFTKRSTPIGLSDALPLLSSSVPAADRIIVARPPGEANEPQMLRSPRSRSPPPKNVRSPGSDEENNRSPSPSPPFISSGAAEPCEAELKNLLAASAPSHRHAWRKGGKAWEMFHQRSRNKKKAKGVIAEEGSGDTSSSLEDDIIDSSDNDSNADGSWHNPSHFASSLPVQIRPLMHYKPMLEPKTSLTDKQGVLVPPLKSTPRSSSSTAIRKAMYAERDRTRSIDPGPTLDFNDETEEDDPEEQLGDGDRGRRHALSILQARSVIPEAGMWRSMAS